MLLIADLGNVELLISHSLLQKRFEEFVTPIDKQIETLQQQNTQLRQIRDRLLPRLINWKTGAEIGVVAGSEGFTLSEALTKD